MSVNESVVFRDEFVSLAGPTSVDLTLHAKDSASFEFSLLPFWFSASAFEIFQMKRCRPTKVHLIFGGSLGTCLSMRPFLSRSCLALSGFSLHSMLKPHTELGAKEWGVTRFHDICAGLLQSMSPWRWFFLFYFYFIVSRFSYAPGFPVAL